MLSNEAHQLRIREPIKGDDLDALFADMEGTIEDNGVKGIGAIWQRWGAAL